MLQLKNRNGDVLYEADVDTWAGHVFPAGLDLSELHVEEGVSFRGATFKGDVWFRHATFKGDAWFNHTRFNGSAWFSYATFEGCTHFFGTTFKGTTSFLLTTFDEVTFANVVFKYPTSFTNIRIKGDKLFSDITFNRLPNNLPVTAIPTLDAGTLTILGVNYVTVEE